MKNYPKDHKVHVLHKCQGGTLAVGKTFRFPSGSRYAVQENGSVINPDKMKLTKAEKKKLKRDRKKEGA